MPGPINRSLRGAAVTLAALALASSPVLAAQTTPRRVVDAHAYHVVAGHRLTVPAPGVLAGRGAHAHAALAATAAHGTLKLRPDGGFTYTPASGYAGTDRFSFRVLLPHAARRSHRPPIVVAITVKPGTQPSGPTGAGQDTTPPADHTTPPAPTPPAPHVVDQSYDPSASQGVPGNTELQVGGTPAARPEVYEPATSNLLAGDSDPAGGSLGVTPGTFASARGGSVTISADGNFSYHPPAGYAGGATGAPDTFSFQVVTSEGGHANATASIHFADTCIWYVDNSRSAGGNGSSSAPFDTLAGAAAQHGGCDGREGVITPTTVYVFAGSGPYDGGIVLSPDQTLTGAPAALDVGFEQVVAPSTGQAVITNSSGDAITVEEGDHVSAVQVSSPSGSGIAASQVDHFTVANDVWVYTPGGDGLHVSGGSGNVTVGASLISAAGHSVYVAGRRGGTVTVSGPVGDTGTGVYLNDNTGATVDFTGSLTATTGAHTAFTATGGGTVDVTDGGTLTTTIGQAVKIENTTIGSDGVNFTAIDSGTVSSGPNTAIELNATGDGYFAVTGTGAAGSGGTIENATSAVGVVQAIDAGVVYLTDMDFTGGSEDRVIYSNNSQGLALTGSSIAGGEGAGVVVEDDGSVADPTYDIENDTITGQAGAAISIFVQGNARTTISGDTIGSAGVVASGSSGGNGIQLESDGGALLAAVTNDTVVQVAQSGILADSEGNGSLSFTMGGDTVRTLLPTSSTAVEVGADGLSNATSSSVCFNPGTDEMLVAAGTYATALELDEDSSGTFDVQGYTGAAADPAELFSYLLGISSNTYTPGSGGSPLIVGYGQNAPAGFTGATCATP